MKTLILILSFFISSVHASDWKKMHGKYVTLEFNPGYETLADSVVNMADRAIPRLAALQGVPLSSFKETKTRIILTDAPDISNGYAVDNAVVLFVRASMYLDLWSGPHSWHKMVLEHELAHHVTFRALWRTSSYFGSGFGLSAPRWFFEGTAQYFAETWTPYRGDMYVKRAVLTGQFTYNSLMDLSNGRLLYASAHAFVRYLADQYGDSTLVQLVNYEKDGFFYEFNKAFKDVYGKTPGELFSYFARHMIIYYGNQAADYPEAEIEEFLPKFGYRDFQVIPFYQQDSTYVVTTILKENHLFTSALIIKIKDGKQEITDVITDNHTTQLYISPDQNYIAYGRINVGIKMNQTSLNFEWHIYNMKTKEDSKVVDNIRAFKAGFTHNNELILPTVDVSSSIIKLYKADGTFIKDLHKTELAVGAVLSFKDGSIVFEAQQKNSQRDLFIIKDDKLEQLTNDSADNKDPVSVKEHLVFNQMIDNNPVISFFNLQTKETKVLINMQDPIIVQQANPDSNTIIVAFRDAGKRLLFAELSVDSLLQNPIVPLKKDTHAKYNSWTTKVAQADSIEESDPEFLAQKVIEDKLFPQANLMHIQSLPIPVYHEDEGAGLFLLSIWIEALERQMLFVNSYLLFNDWDKSYLSLVHNIRLFNMDITSFYYHGPGFITRINGDYTELVHDYAAIAAGQYSYFDGNQFLPYAWLFSYRTDNFRKESGGLDYSYHGPSIEAGIGYELPSRFQNIFPKREIKGSLEYFQSMHPDWDFSVVDLSLKAGTNLFSEKFGIVSRLNYIQTNGDVSPSAATGIDQDYQYAIPRDFLNTKTIRGIRNNYFGDKLLWTSTELTLLLAQKTSMKVLFLPVNEMAISGFFDDAKVINNDVTTDLYSYGGELSIGFGALRVGFGYAVGNVDGKELDGEYYGRLNLSISNVLNGTGIK